MRAALNIATLLLLTTVSYGQVTAHPIKRLPTEAVQRLDNESAEHYALKVKPDSSKLTYKVIETKWNAESVIIAFYEQNYKLPKRNDPNQQNYLCIIATVFIPTKNGCYEYLTDTIYSEGGDPKIENAFFANTDTDSKKELVIIASWEQRHYGANGTLYGAFVFDDLLKNAQKQLTFMKDISEKLDGGMEGTVEGKDVTAKFKTKEDIKKELLRQGYKQY